MPDDGFLNDARRPVPPPPPVARRFFGGPYRTSRYLIWLGAALIASSLIVGAVVLWQMRAATVSRAETDLRRFALVLGEQTLAAIQGIDFALRTLMDSPRDDEQERFALHKEMKGIVATVPQVQNLFVIDKDGDNAASARSYPAPRIALADRPFFAEHKEGHEGAYFTSAFRNRIDGRWSIVMTRRLETPEGQFDGVIAADLNPAYLARFYSAIDMGPGAGIVLIDRRGTLLSRHPWIETATGRAVPGSEALLGRLEREKTGAFLAVSPFDGVERLHGYAALDAYPLVLVTFADMDVVLAGWRQQAFVAGAGLLAADAVIAALIAILVIQIRRRERSESRFRDFAGSVSDWYWETDSDLRFTYVSRVGRGGADIAVQEAIGRTFADLIVTLPGDETWPRFEADIAVRAPFRDFLCLVRTPADRLRHVNISGRPHNDERGAFCGYRGVARDITSEVEARSASAQANMRFLHAIENSNDGIAFWDSEDRFVLCNERYRESAGRAARFLIPGVAFERYFWEAIRLGDIPVPPGKAAETLARRLERHQAGTGAPYEIEHGGEWRLIRDQRTPNGGTLTVWTDITALKTQEVELRVAQDAALHSRQQFLAAIEHSDDGFALWDRDDRLVLCNERYRRRAGASGSLLEPGVAFETFVREGIRLGEFEPGPDGDLEALVRRRLDMHRRGTGEPMEMTRLGRRHVIRDQRMPDGGCLTISTDVTRREQIADDGRARAGSRR
jgi:PAS domain S-box-containing protein